jgi:hypothetical protein
LSNRCFPDCHLARARPAGCRSLRPQRLTAVSCSTRDSFSGLRTW